MRTEAEIQHEARFAEYMHERAAVKKAAERRAAVLAGPRASELRDLESRIESLRTRQHGVMAGPLAEYRTCYDDEKAEFDLYQSEIEKLEREIKSLLRQS